MPLIQAKGTDAALCGSCRMGRFNFEVPGQFAAGERLAIKDEFGLAQTDRGWQIRTDDGHLTKMSGHVRCANPACMQEARSYKLPGGENGVTRFTYVRGLAR